MNGLRFKVGDMAIYVIPYHAKGYKWVGEIVEVIEVGPFSPDHVHPSTGKFASLKSHDYMCKHYSSIGGVWDWQLKPIDAPEVPHSITEREEVEA